MPLVTTPLDYSSAATQQHIDGIRSNIQQMYRGMEEQRAEKKRQEARSAQVQTSMAGIQGSTATLDDKSRQLFEGGYMAQYQYYVDQYAENPTQDNMNNLVRSVAEAENFVKFASQAYQSDKKTYITGRLNPSGYTTSTQDMDAMFGARWATPFSEVGFDPSFGVYAIDQANGIADPTPPAGLSIYSTDAENAFYFMPKQKTPNYISPQEYGTGKASMLRAANQTKNFGTIFNAEAETEAMRYSIAMTFVASGADGLMPEDVMANPELFAQAREDYYNTANSSMRNAVYQISKASRGEGQFSGVKVDANIGSETYPVSMYKSPQNITIPSDYTSESSDATEVTVTGHHMIPNGGGIVLSTIDKTYSYVDPSGKVVDPLSIPAQVMSNPQAAGYRKEENLTRNVRKITDPVEYEAVVRALQIKGLISADK